MEAGSGGACRMVVVRTNKFAPSGLCEAFCVAPAGSYVRAVVDPSTRWFRTESEARAHAGQTPVEDEVVDFTVFF